MDQKIRKLMEKDPAMISAAFDDIGWNKPALQYERYLKEQEAGTREVLVALTDDTFSGYVTIVWESGYEPFRDHGIPEIQDFNVLPKFRRQRIGSALLDEAEDRISTRSATVGIGVGMYPDYGNAQRLYVLRGYVPDGRGLTYNHKVLEPLAQAINDDNLVLYFTKSISRYS